MKKLKTIFSEITNVFKTRPSNAFLLFLSGFLFSQFILLNTLLIKDPLGGWVTSFGSFSTSSILFTSLILLSFCLIALWRSVSKSKASQETVKPKISMVKIQSNFSPIDYPKGSTQSVVPGYAVG